MKFYQKDSTLTGYRFDGDLDSEFIGKIRSFKHAESITDIHIETNSGSPVLCIYIIGRLGGVYANPGDWIVQDTKGNIISLSQEELDDEYSGLSDCVRDCSVPEQPDSDEFDPETAESEPDAILITSNSDDAVEYLARELHESARPAYEKGCTVAQKTGMAFPFKNWDEIPEDARNGRVLSARYLLDKFLIAAKKNRMPGALLKEWEQRHK